MPFPKRNIPVLWLAGIFLLNLSLRLPTVGHFLTWDEAWVLCALKDFFSANQPFSIQFGKHPPIYLSLGLLLLPTKPGFELRMQLFSLIINSGALVFFTILFAKLYGRKSALLAALIYTMLPGTMFFDSWIKRDALVTLFCALTLLSLLKKKDILAGIFCGLSFLSKETAVFFAFGYLAFILIQRPASELRRSLIRFCGAAAVIASWWYIFFYPFTDAYLAFFKGHSEEAKGLIEPWWYYFAKLKIDLGLLVLLFLIAGLIAVVPSACFKKRTANLSCFKRFRFLPLFMLLPGYVFLSFSKGKPPWMTISFPSFLALLLAFGCLFLFKLTSQAQHKITGRKILHNKWVALILLIGLLTANTFPFSYGNHFKSMSPNLAKMTLHSYEMSDVVNKNVAENENLLILPMIFRTFPNSADPIFNFNLKPVETLYYKGSNLNFAQFHKNIIQNKINWVLIFPVTGSWQEELFKQIIEEMDPVGYMFSAGYLLRVDADQP
ncbi:ArnT family glycosyltransferase [Thermodesulfobacteriota bacterium]